MPEEGVVVEVHLRVERDDLPLDRDHERVDLGERGVGRDVGGVERRREADEAVDAVALQPHPEREPARLERQEPGERVDRLAQELLRVAARDLLDRGPALDRGHHDHAAALPIERHAQVELPRDPATLLDVDLANELAGRAGLGGSQDRAEHGLRVAPRLGGRAGELDAASLPAAAGVDLRLDRARIAAPELPGGALCLHRAHGEVPPGYGHPELPE